MSFSTTLPHDATERADVQTSHVSDAESPLVSAATPTNPVLVALHGSVPADEPIVAIGARAAVACGVPLQLLSVLPAMVAAPAPRGSAAAARRERDETLLLDRSLLENTLRVQLGRLFRDATTTMTPPPYSIRVVSGDPDRVLPTLTAPTNATAMVIGRSIASSDISSLYSLVQSLRSTRVCHTARIPIIVVGTAEASEPFATVVIATDFSAPSWEAATMATRLAAPGAHIHVVHVHPNDPLARRSWYQDAMRAALTGWAQSLAALAPHGVQFHVAALTGYPYAELRDYMRTVGATALAVGGHAFERNTVTAPGYTLPERFLSTWSGSIVLGPSAMDA